MYTMGRAGTLPARFGRVHPVHQTPTFAIAFVQIFGIVAVLLVGLLLRPEYIFGLLETIATLAVIVLYCMANLALTSYIRREHRRQFQRLASRCVALDRDPGAAACLFVTVYPVPAWPYNIAPYFFVVSLVAGFGYMQWLELRHPGALSGAQPCWSAAAARRRAMWTGTSR